MKKLKIGWGLRGERVPFRMAMGRSVGDDKTNVEEEITIGNESVEGLVLVRGR